MKKKVSTILAVLTVLIIFIISVLLTSCEPHYRTEKAVVVRIAKQYKVTDIDQTYLVLKRISDNTIHVTNILVSIQV